MLIVVGALAAITLAAFSARRVRILAVGAALAALLAAPAVWAVDTLGYATNGTFPSGGPASVQTAGGGVFGGGGFGGRGRAAGFRGGGAGGAGVQLFGSGGLLERDRRRGGQPGGAPPAAGTGGIPAGGPPGLPGGAGSSGFGGGPGARGGPGAGGGAIGAPIGNSASLTRVLSYVKKHGGGTVAVASQSSAAQAIIDDDADVAGIGGFSGRESDVSVAWLAREVRAGHIRWVVGEGSGAQGGPRLPGDTRTGSKTAMAAVAKVCTAVKLSTSTSTGTSSGRGAAATSSEGSLYDCQGRAAALLSASAQQSSS